MRLVKLNDEYTVMPDEISKVRVNWDNGTITVHMRDGSSCSLRAGYREALSDTHTKLINDINEAMQ